MDKRLETEMIEFLYNAFESARERRAARAQSQRGSRWAWAELVHGVRSRFAIVLRGERQSQDSC